MKKKLAALLFAVLLICTVSMPAFAETALPRLCDNAGLLTSTEQSELLASLDDVSARLSFDVVIVTTNSTEGKTAMAYADDYFDYNGFGQGSGRDGAVLLVSMDPGNRQAWISTSGYGITAMTDAGIDYMLDIVVDEDLHNGEYNQAFEDFISLSEDSSPTRVRIGLTMSLQCRRRRVSRWIR